MLLGLIWLQGTERGGRELLAKFSVKGEENFIGNESDNRGAVACESHIY